MSLSLLCSCLLCLQACMHAVFAIQKQGSQANRQTGRQDGIRVGGVVLPHCQLQGGFTRLTVVSCLVSILILISWAHLHVQLALPSPTPNPPSSLTPSPSSPPFRLSPTPLWTCPRMVRQPPSTPSPFPPWTRARACLSCSCSWRTLCRGRCLCCWQTGRGQGGRGGERGRGRTGV